MNKAMLAVGIILLSLIAFATINLIQDFSTGQELDYYLLKETADAAMIDAIDFSFYGSSGSVRMDKEKFVESFLVRFAKNASSKDYDIYFYDINETPPKASVKVEAVTLNNNINKDDEEKKAVITTTYSNLLETKYLTNDFITEKIARNELPATSE